MENRTRGGVHCYLAKCSLRCRSIFPATAVLVAELFPGRGRQCFHHSEISREVGRQSGLSVISTERSGKVSSGARAKNVCDFNSRSPPAAPYHLAVVLKNAFG
jgi:hypothetical protein